MTYVVDATINFGVYACLYIYHLSFFNFHAGNVESAKEKNDLELSLNPNGFITGKDQNIDISEIPDGAGCSERLNQVTSLHYIFTYN